jgi:serine/threonine-protein kinase
MHQIGDLLAGKYQLVRSIGKGGMGEVYEAIHVDLGKRFAIKIPTAELMEDEVNLERFKREPRMAAATGHRGIVDVYDIGVTAHGVPFVVMEYLEGESFSDLIEREGKADVHLATYVIAQVLSALTAAHGKGIVHRDLKPDNVFLVYDPGQPLPEVKLLDFGTSKLVEGGAVNHSLTQSGTILGTPYYMAPEQIRADRRLDGRLDVYAAGVMLYEAVTGHVPFHSDNVYTLVHMILNEELVRPRVLRGDLPEELEQVILRAMERNREQRYASAEAMLEALLPMLDDLVRSRIWVPAGLRGMEEPSGSITLGRSVPPSLNEPSGGLARARAAIAGDPTAVLGRYLPLKKLARGESATIYLGRFDDVDGARKPVALKVIHPHLTDDKSFVREFLEAAKLATRLAHPNIVQVLDYGEHGGSYVTVQEYVHGYHLSDLTRYLASTGRALGLEHAVYVVFRVLQGLAFAHGRTDTAGSPLELVHRAVCPQNVLLSTSGEVKLAGFGLVEHKSEASGKHGGGSFAYMSPEQITGGTLDHRTDIFSLGIVLYEILTGQSLFGTGTDAMTVMRVSKADVPDVRLLRPDLPPLATAVLATALARDPERRFPNAAAFATELRGLLGGQPPDGYKASFESLAAHTFAEGDFRQQAGKLFDLARALEARPIAVGAGPVAEAPPLAAPAPAAARERPPKRPRRGLIVALAAAVIALAGAGVGVFYAVGAGRAPGGGGDRRPVALIINQGGGDAAPDRGPARDARAAADASAPDNATPPPLDAGAAPGVTPDGGSPPGAADAAAGLEPGKAPAKVHRTPPSELSGRVVTQTLLSRQGALLGCVRQSAGSKLAISAIRVSIRADGSVESASVEPAEANASPLGRCVVAVARSIDFPRHDKALSAFRVPARLQSE